MTDLHWLAGWIEGEGTFVLHRGSGYPTPVLAVSTTDRDVAIRAYGILKPQSRLYLTRYEQLRRPKQKVCYVIQMGGRRAVAWMMTLYALLGNRRRGRIRIVLGEYRRESVKTRPCRRDINGVPKFHKTRGGEHVA